MFKASEEEYLLNCFKETSIYSVKGVLVCLHERRLITTISISLFY